MQSMNVRNVFNRMVFKGEFVQISEKIIGRFFDRKKNTISTANMAWLWQNAIEIEAFAKALDAPLWAEAIAETNIIRANAAETLKDIAYDLGGGGAYDLLYFLVRYLKPQTIVETGVAAGFSSYAFLQAIKANQQGRLLSSDFPYFRLPDPEAFIGIVVPEALGKDWTLFIEGDRKNLQTICSQCEEIDLFHYDSDKSYNGRDYALSLVKPKFTAHSVVIMDDIEDNDFFFDFVRDNALKNFQVFRFEGKFLAMWWGENVSLKQTACQ